MRQLGANDVWMGSEFLESRWRDVKVVRDLVGQNC
jgi:hypothetical protein